LTFCDGFGQLVAFWHLHEKEKRCGERERPTKFNPCIRYPASCILCHQASGTRQKSGTVPKLEQTRTGATADLCAWSSALRSFSGGKMLRIWTTKSPLECKEASMARSNLRIYRGPEASASVRAASKVGNPNVTVSVGEVLPLLADAFNSQRTWLEDFEGDELTISADLYEVLLAYQYYRHPAA
jgi:hypothetical protein